jgi:hypothetical protein
MFLRASSSCARARRLGKPNRVLLGCRPAGAGPSGGGANARGCPEPGSRAESPPSPWGRSRAREAHTIMHIYTPRCQNTTVENTVVVLMGTGGSYYNAHLHSKMPRHHSGEHSSSAHVFPDWKICKGASKYGCAEMCFIYTDPRSPGSMAACRRESVAAFDYARA